MTTSPARTGLRSGIDTSSLDPAVRPQDDLFRHVNGRWLAEHEIPADRAVDGAFRLLHDRAEEHVRAIIAELGENASADGGTPAAQVGALYASFMDTERVEALGLDPIRPELERIDAAADRAELVTVLGELQRTGGAGAVGFWVDNDAKDPERYVVFLHQGGLGLPDEAYYREDTYAAVREQYRRVRVLAVVRLVRQPQASLVQEDHVPVRVLRVVVHPEPDGARAAGALQLTQHGDELHPVGGGVDPLELGADRVKAERRHPFGVHERGVERADLGSWRAAVRGSVLTELGDDGPDMLLGLVVQQAERAVHGAVGGDLVLGQPTSVHVPEQVVLWPDGRVEAGRVDAAAQPGPGGGCRHRDRLRARFN